MKYFIGISLPAHLSDKILSFQKSFTNNKLPEILEPHITVKTKNGLTEDCDWLNKVKMIIESHPEFEIDFEGIDTFGDDAVILKLSFSKELMRLHKALYYAIKPDENDTTKKYFEDDKYEAHLTLGMNLWGMTIEDLIKMKEKGLKELPSISKFKVTFIRVYQQANLDEPYKKFLDIPLNETG